MTLTVAYITRHERKPFHSLAATLVLIVLSLLFLIYCPGIAAASGAGKVTTFPLTGFSPAGITAGPDGSLWFTGYSGELGQGAVGSISPSGAINVHSAGVNGTSVNETTGITTGPDGALWFAVTGHNGAIGRITTAGTITYPDPVVDEPEAITKGPDGNLWFATAGGSAGSIGRITTSGTVTTYANTGIDMPAGIVAGPGGNLWFTNYGNNTIGRITPAGVVKDFTGTGIDQPNGITVGPDGALWFTNVGNNSIGRITRWGKVSNYTGPGISTPDQITVGSDGALWFTNEGSNPSIGRITRLGVVTAHPDAGLIEPMGTAAGSDGALWFTSWGSGEIGRITTGVTPQITSFTPTSGAPGTTVTIKGQNLSGATNVAFNGTAATIISNTAYKIVMQVPASATAGPITVTTRAGTATSTQPFT
jgi:virginiamycin B lyase